MITDARVLDAEFIPKDVVHRDPEINTLSAALDPVTRGEPAETALLVGPSGAGKTCIVQYTVDHLRETVIDLNMQYVNCWKDYSRLKALYRVLEGIDRTPDANRQSTPTDELLGRLHEYDGSPYVVILDEIDQHTDISVLYDLTRARHAIATDQLERIAEAGDARVAIAILRGAAREAVHDGAEKISDDHIQTTIPHAKAEIKRKSLEKLTSDQRILYEVMSDHGEIAPSDLYEAYRDRADNPKTERTVRSYLQKLQHYNLITAKGDGHGRTYQTLG